MSKFKEYVNAPAGSRFLMEGNTAFALGAVHAGYHAADGYPGTPSTEIIDKCLQYVQDRMIVGWSVNEAVSVGVGVGHAIAGFDALVTMKIPGIFQAADVITTSAFYTAQAGALVIFAAADFVPSSTQHIIDPRYFFASSRLPVLEPRSLQEMYEMPAIAADISKKFKTPVIVMANGILNHTEGIVEIGEQRENKPLPLPKNLTQWMHLPKDARINYDIATQERIPELREWLNTSNLFNIEKGTDDWAVIVIGKNEMLINEVKQLTNTDPSVFSLAATHPLPEKELIQFASENKGKLFVIEDGDTFVQEKLIMLGFNPVGKKRDSIITNWRTKTIINFLSDHIPITKTIPNNPLGLEPIPRIPAICPGCPYKAFTLAIQQLKKKKIIYASFGDIGCSSLTASTKTIDTILCMGAADSIRQGFALSRPELAHKMISVIGDSSECHSGLDSTRNAIFRNVPGVKVILDNSMTAMTGGQPAPSTLTNLSGMPHKFDLRRAVEAEGGRTVVVDSYKIEDIENSLIEALDMAEHGVFTTMILKGACVKNLNGKSKVRSVEFDHDACTNCGRCEICPGIGRDENKKLHFTESCTDCGENLQVCMQRCPHNAILPMDVPVAEGVEFPKLNLLKELTLREEVVREELPASIRMAVRGVGGQGNLFFGKVLTEVVMQTNYAKASILKSDTHGMAQLGGAVISTFSCGDVHSAQLTNASADVLVAMELNEVLHPGYLDLLKPGGYLLLNKQKVLTTRQMARKYPDYEKIKEVLANFNVIEVDANQAVLDMGDKKAQSANVYILGALSRLKPFSLFPEKLWVKALTSLSKDERIKTLNLNAFVKGRAIVDQKQEAFLKV